AVPRRLDEMEPRADPCRPGSGSAVLHRPILRPAGGDDAMSGRITIAAFEQVRDADLHARINPSQNSIAAIIQHLHGNMISRFTDFLTTDGEKPTRDREGEF